MKTKILTFFIVVLFFAFPVVGQNTSVPDVDSLGDIWVITIDNTYSMSRRGGKSIDMDAVGKGVEQRIVNSNAFDSINWGKDRFLILKSGIGDGTKRRFVDTQFIKHTDTVLHSYENKGNFAGDIGNILAHGDYNNYVSFVSQMRLLSLCKALDFISDNGLQNKYRYINIVTISDDAVDQHDQWSTDYRTLKECCPDKVEYLSGLARKYIYNPLNGWGGGEMNLGWSDETRLPHIWLYHYVTSEGRLKMDTSNVYVDVVARDGKRLQFNVMEGETVPCLYWIDSVCVNKNVIKIDRHFTDSLTINAEYENDLINNVVAVYGKAQFEYNDSLLGPHYRVVDFVQHTTSMPRHLSITLNVLALVAILGVILFILLWFNLVVLRIYANGKRLNVKWYAMNRLRHDDFTLLALILNPEGKTDAVFYKGQGFSIKNDNKTNTDEKVAYIKSLRRLTPEYKDLFVEENRSSKNFRIEFDEETTNQFFSFQYSNRLSHKLVIKFERVESCSVESSNILQERNLRMLASYYEQNADKINSLKNNVMVNIIGRETLGADYNEDYAVLNIFDLNSQNASNRIFLRFSLMCFFDRNSVNVKDVRTKLLNLARYVLKSERQSNGHFAELAFSQKQYSDSGIKVDVSPFLSYLYLVKKGKNRLVYSPFRDGKLGLAVKTIDVFSNANMVLMNLPIKFKYPENRIEDPSKIELGKNYHKTENLVFLGNDTIKFMDKEKRWGYGNPVPFHAGITYYSWRIDSEFLR